MVDTVRLILQDMQEHYGSAPRDPKISRLYEQTDPRVAAMFAYFHAGLNGHFEFANFKMDRGGHFNAEDSRNLHELILEFDKRQKQLATAGIDVAMVDSYRAVVDRFRTFLQLSGGSPLPSDLDKIDILEYEPAFTIGEATIRLPARMAEPFKLQLIGNGAFADVFKYTDTDLGKTFAVKRVKPGATDKERERFTREYNVMHGLSFPYILEVYSFDAAKHQYTMEYCDSTLKKFYEKTNNSIPFASRKRIALQFLFGLNYLHQRKVLHRDLSMNNLLVKEYDLGAVIVKLSDFGLVKEDSSELTSVDSSIKGTMVDPNLTSFADYSIEHEVWAVGAMLSFIFSGRQGLRSNTGEIQAVIDKCTNPDPALRYQSIAEVIAAVDDLSAPPSTEAVTA